MSAAAAKVLTPERDIFVARNDESPTIVAPKPFKTDLCKFCWDVIYHELGIEKTNCRSSNWQRPVLPVLPKGYDRNLNTPLFVTWNTFENGYESLRGCIGSLDNIKFEPGLRDYALKSAFQDGRFNPIMESELKYLECRVSILHSFEESDGCYDWERGTHGIILKFSSGGRHYSATYLPEIPVEHDMSREVAIEELARKAGYRGLITTTLLNNMRVTRYQSVQIAMSNEKYLGSED